LDVVVAAAVVTEDLEEEILLGQVLGLEYYMLH
jgi:hypothetical protein